MRALSAIDDTQKQFARRRAYASRRRLDPFAAGFEDSSDNEDTPREGRVKPNATQSIFKPSPRSPETRTSDPFARNDGAPDSDDDFLDVPALKRTHRRPSPAPGKRTWGLQKYLQDSNSDEEAAVQRSAEVKALETSLRQRGRTVTFSSHSKTDDGRQIPLVTATEHPSFRIQRRSLPSSGRMKDIKLVEHAIPGNDSTQHQLGNHGMGHATATTLARSLDQAGRQIGDALDEKSDFESFGGSLWSEAPSIASSMSSIGSSSISEEIIAEFVNALFYNEETFPITVSAFESSDINHENFRKAVQQLICEYGNALVPECRGPSEREAAKLLQSRKISACAAQQVLKQAEEYRTKTPTPTTTTTLCQNSSEEDMGGSSRDLPGDELEGQGTKGTNDFSDGTRASPLSESGLDLLGEHDFGGGSHASSDNYDINNDSFQLLMAFSLATGAYEWFQDRFLNLVHQPYRQKIHKALTGQCTSHGKEMTKEASYSLSDELAWVPAHFFKFCQHEPFSFANSAKAFLEDVTSESWHWWPLLPRKHQVRPGFRRLYWQSPSGTSEFVDVSEKAAGSLQAVFASAPAYIADGTASASQATNTAASATNVRTNTRPDPASLNQAESATSLTPSNPGVVNAQASNNSVPPSQPQLLESRQVYFCVRKNRFLDTVFLFRSLRTEKMKIDREFFMRLKSEYFHARGWFRNWFSMYRYDHCEFFLFRKYDVESSEPVKLDFPSNMDMEYDFNPRPMMADSRPPYGPIGPKQFHSYFYKSTDDTWRLFQKQCVFRNRIKAESLKALPKHKREIDMTDDQTELYWGIYAKEKRWAVWVFAYIFLLNLPWIIFAFLWLFQWRHVSDLQNGFIPLGTSVTLTMGFAALLVAGPSDGRG